MADIIIPNGSFVTTRLGGKGWDGFSNVPKSLQPGMTTVTVDNPSAAYVADMGPGASGIGRIIAIVPKVTPPIGGSTTVFIDITAKDAVGMSSLAPLHLEVRMDGPTPNPPEASILEYWDNLTPGAHVHQTATTQALSEAPTEPTASPLTF